ncbi:hypothetical protein HPB48_007246 [Haemaphysalis longicornis]|uniref:Uncharacterized protein n=1 Tax=Haemaphysalis longicornis TaxID=44386 RepID=A0A9J6H1F9_HAELO|nr:hypothetical protein HPB48_007246 [Haemaphysalis longicornis]
MFDVEPNDLCVFAGLTSSLTYVAFTCAHRRTTSNLCCVHVCPPQESEQPLLRSRVPIAGEQRVTFVAFTCAQRRRTTSNLCCFHVCPPQENNEFVANEVKQEIGSAPHSYQCDVSDEKQVRQLARRVADEVGPVAVLVNNAAVTQCQPLLTLKPDQIRRTLDVNLLSHFWVCTLCTPLIPHNSPFLSAITLTDAIFRIGGRKIARLLYAKA